MTVVPEESLVCACTGAVLNTGVTFAVCTAPTSQLAGRVNPRWSVGGQSLDFAAPISGLPGCGASVGVEPPFDSEGLACRSGFLPLRLTPQLPSLSRLFTLDVAGAKQSPLGGLSATTVLTRPSVVAELSSMPPSPF